MQDNTLITQENPASRLLVMSKSPAGQSHRESQPKCRQVNCSFSACPDLIRGSRHSSYRRRGGRAGVSCEQLLVRMPASGRGSARALRRCSSSRAFGRFDLRRFPSCFSTQFFRAEYPAVLRRSHNRSLRVALLLSLLHASHHIPYPQIGYEAPERQPQLLGRIGQHRTLIRN